QSQRNLSFRPPTGSVQSRVKSSAELEEEMLANIPKFRARPFNKKVRIRLP
ncbi:Os02g0326500, partial [Oryza sativa Japonica Group]